MDHDVQITVVRDEAATQPAVFVAAWLLAAMPAQPEVIVRVVDRVKIELGGTSTPDEALVAAVGALLVEQRFAGWRIATPEDRMPQPYPGVHDDQLPRDG